MTTIEILYVRYDSQQWRELLQDGYHTVVVDATGIATMLRQQF